MKVLFIGRSYSGKPSPIIKAQADSLIAKGVDIRFYGLESGGIKGYLSSFFRLRKFVRSEHFDLFHAHYSFTSFIATLAGLRPLVVSLMGSDIKLHKWSNRIALLLNRFFWKACIVKSGEMKALMKNHSRVHVIPNGVDFEVFKPISKSEALKKTGFDPLKKNILFLADPARNEKNFPLAEEAVRQLNRQDVDLKVVKNASHDLIPFYLSAADVLILTSLYEGSPNVIKEAMACNLPIVSTRVGDVEQVIGKTRGCFITSFEPENVAENLSKALLFNGRTQGREDISHLDSRLVAEKIIALYTQALS